MTTLYGATTIIDATPTLTVAGAYVSGDFVGTSATPITFANAARYNGGGGIVPGAILVDGDKQSISSELWLFDTTFTPPADNAAWSISDAAAARCIGVIQFISYYASALNSIADGLPVKPITFQCLSTSRDLYGAVITRGAPTYTSGLVTVRLAVLPI